MLAIIPELSVAVFGTFLFLALMSLPLYIRLARKSDDSELADSLAQISAGHLAD